MCFLDADHGVAEGFAEDILSRFSEDAFLVPDDSGPGFDSVLICGARTFAQVGGYDETFLDWGEETLDLRDTLRRAGLKARTFPASLLVPNKQSSNRSRWARVRSAETRQAIHAAIRRAKTAILAETGGIRPAGWREMYRVITAHHLAGRTDPVGVPHAVVAFRESMGYTIARLEAGASSHNNEGRPIVSVPPALRGLMFTQVVACRASPVEVEFRSAGRLYVLVGTDWEGCEPLRGALDDVAVREAMPALETAGGREFEVWSLHGEAGEHLTLPTQVMLVSSELHPVTFDVPELA